MPTSRELSKSIPCHESQIAVIVRYLGLRPANHIKGTPHKWNARQARTIRRAIKGKP